MFKSLAAAFCGLMAVSAVWAADLPVKAPLSAADSVSQPAWTVTTSTEFRYFSWNSNRGTPSRVDPTSGGGSGSEIYIPFAAQLVGRPSNDVKVEFLARGGWVWARQNTAGLTGEVGTSTDTQAAATVTYLGMRGFQPFVATSVNLPTGRASLNGLAANARMDPDLVDITSFGEGFNVGPSIGFSIPITGDLVVTSSAGYTWRDSYSREAPLETLVPSVQIPTNVKPGEVWTATTSIADRWGQWSGSILGSLSWEGVTAENGVSLYKPGNRYLITGTLSYTWANGSLTALTGSYAHSNRNEVLFANASTLLKEIMNTNSDVSRIGLQHLIPFDRLTIGPTGSFLHRDHNSYNVTTLQFVPEKDRWAAGFVARYAASDRVTLNARIERVWTHEDEQPAIGNTLFSVLGGFLVPGSTIPVVSSTGWQAAIGATARF